MTFIQKLNFAYFKKNAQELGHFPPLHIIMPEWFFCLKIKKRMVFFVSPRSAFFKNQLIKHMVKDIQDFFEKIFRRTFLMAGSQLQK